MTGEQIYYYKDLYSGHKLIYVRLFHNDFLFRTLTRKEYKYIRSCFHNQYEIEDAICNTSCVYPEEYSFSDCPFAGLVKYASDAVEYQSGFKDIMIVLDYYKEYKKIDTMENQCMDLIKAFIPEYTYEQMYDWSWEHLMEITARAEKVAAYHDKQLSLMDISEEQKKEYDKMNKDNPEFIDKLYSSGIDPMKRFESEIDKKTSLLDFPLIGSQHWNNEPILDLIRRQTNGSYKQTGGSGGTDNA